LRDVLSGPDHMRRTLRARMPEARELARRYPETVVHKDPEQVLHSRRGRQVFAIRRRHDFDSPTGLRLGIFTARTILSHFFRRPDPANVATPEVRSEEHTSELQSRENIVCRL